MFPAGRKTIKHGQADDHDAEQHRPSQQAEQRFGPSPQTEKGQDQRQDHDGAKCGQNGKDGAGGKDKGNEIKLDEAAFLLLVVDHVERIDERLHAGIGAP